MDIKEDNDSMSFKDYQINPTLNIYENFDSSLNSKSNPFIKASKIIAESSQLPQIISAIVNSHSFAPATNPVVVNEDGISW